MFLTVLAAAAAAALGVVGRARRAACMGAVVGFAALLVLFFPMLTSLEDMLPMVKGSTPAAHTHRLQNTDDRGVKRSW